MINIVQATPEDAKEMVEFTKIVGSETDNLSFGSEGIGLTSETQRTLETINKSNKAIFLLAKDDEKIVGISSFVMNRNSRMNQRGEIAITILKDYWSLGIGSQMVAMLIRYARDVAKAKLIHLEVRSDNERAIRLYKKFGFKTIGTFPKYLCIDNQTYDCDFMVLDLEKESLL